MKFRVNDPLSITAAARDAADVVALHVGHERFTFARLADLVRERLASLGPELAPGRPVPLVGRNRLERIVTLYTLLEARVPVLLLHPKLTEAERAAEIAATARAAGTLPEDAAVIMYTSGTTGQSRGAVLTRSALVASALASAANMGWEPDDCWLLAMPIARVGGLSIVTRCLIARRAVALAPSFDAALVPAWIDQWRVTLASMVPTMLTLVLDRHPDWRPPPFLRCIQVGGAEAPPRLLKEVSTSAGGVTRPVMGNENASISRRGWAAEKSLPKISGIACDTATTRAIETRPSRTIATDTFNAKCSPRRAPLCCGEKKCG